MLDKFLSLNSKYYLYLAMFFMILSLVTHTSLFSLGFFSGMGVGLYIVKRKK